MATSIIIEEQIEIPFVGSLADFRAWALSDGFPERGRIDYIGGRIEVDMSPEDIFCHGTLKTEIVAVLVRLVKEGGLGYLLSDRTRVSCPEADLSVEPDIVFVSEESLESGRVRLVPKGSGEEDRYVEVEGAADLIVEIVSDSSVTKDTHRLPAAYARAGVREFWLADARGKRLIFEIHDWTPAGYQAAQRDADGFQRSAVFGTAFRLTRHRNPHGRWTFDLQTKAG
jgi:Uma2 family endonuclease